MTAGNRLLRLSVTDDIADAVLALSEGRPLMSKKMGCAFVTVVVLPFLLDATTGCFTKPPRPVAPNSYVCSCDCQPEQHTQRVRVSASLDDAEQSSLDITDLKLGVTLVGVRFVGLDLPQGATILSAAVQFTAHSTFSGDNSVASNLDIVGVAADNASPFTSNTSVSLTGLTLTAASVAWQPPPPPWSVNESHPAELTPDLSPIIQEIVNRPGWQPGNALVLLFTGSGRREAESFDGNPATSAVLSVEYGEPGPPAHFDLSVCVPPALNGNLSGGSLPTETDLQTDCTTRVQPTLIDLDQACHYPSVCSCGFVPDSERYAGSVCDGQCAPAPVDSQCTNFDPKNGQVQANAAGSDPPVCTAFSPLGADLFGQRTSCTVEGNAHITVSDGDNTDSEDSHTTGVVQFVGEPCSPGQSCPAGMAYRLDFGNVEVGNFFESATFNKLAGLGENLAGQEATISPSGDATFGSQTLGNAAQGRQDQGELHGVESTNDSPVAVNVGWNQGTPMCSVQGDLVGSVDPELMRCSGGPDDGKICQSDSDCTPDPGCTNGVCSCVKVQSAELTIGLNVTGSIDNQPPKADAGPDQTIECSAAAVTNVVLDGSGSSDPDNNIAFYTWLRGSRVGEEVGSAAVAHVQQALGSETWVLRVIDSDGQGDEDSVTTRVADTTPPVLTCAVGMPVLSQTNHDLVNVGLMATADDTCEGALPVTVNVFGNEDDQDSTGDGIFSPDANDLAVDTLRLRAERKGNGPGRVYLIITEATDSSGNRGFNCCTVTVPLSQTQASLTTVQNQAAAARAFCLANDGTAPAGYFVIGDGPVLGPKQ